MAQLLSTWIDGFIGSAKATGNKVKNAFGKVIPEMKQYFTSDFMGKGWLIFKSGGTDENPEYTLEIDNIKIRKALIAHELIVDQIRAICGSLGVSQACGKVKSVSENELFYFLNMEGEETHGYGGFQIGDLVRCQRLTANGINGYWVQVTNIVTNENGFHLVIPKDQFTNGNIYQQTSGNDADNVDTTKATGVAMCTPSAGDNLVQYGNVSDKTRQNAIYIHADGMGRPAIDMLEGINSRSFVGKIVCRLGGELPEGGFGFYCENGKIISTDGTETNYRFSPDGTFELGKGAITYKEGVVTLSPEVVINWGATSQANVQYCISTSGSTQPTEGWSNTIPTLEQGKWLWTRTKYPDGTFTYSVSYCSKDGEPGTSIKIKGTKQSIDELPTPPEDDSDCYIIGQDLYVWDGTNWQNVGQFKGDKGDTGIGIVSVNTIYALGVYGNIEPEESLFKYDTMSSIVIADNSKSYLWSADKVAYTNGVTALTGKYCVGRCDTLTNITEQYGTSTSNTTQPATWVDNTFPTGLTEGTWIWSRDKVTWKDNSVTYSEAKIKGYIAKKGDKGDKGDKGIGITSVNTFYALNEYSQRIPNDNAFTYDKINSVVISENAEQYLWSGDKVTYTDNTTAITGKYCLGQCKDLANITEQYGTSESSTTKPTDSSWVDDDFPTGLNEGTYIWSRNKITWKDGNVTYSNAQLVGYIAKDGIGLLSVNTFYSLTPDGIQPPAEDHYEEFDTISGAVIEKNAEQYLWSVDKVTYTDDSYEYTNLNLLGQCKELASVTEQYGTSTSNKQAPTTGWVETEFPTGLAEGTYIWTRNKITWKNGNTSYSDAKLVGYIAKKGDKGDKGEDGQSLRPNLLDYTALTADTFTNPPSGVTIGGIRTTDVPDGCGGIFVNKEITDDYYDLFREDILSRLQPSTQYTISFLLRKIDTSSTADAKFAVILHTGTTGSEFINLDKSVIVNGETETLTSNVISLTHSGGAYTRYTITFTTASDLSSLSHAYFLWRMYKGSAGLILGQMKVERSGAASEWCLSETDKFVALPTWVRQWDGTATQIGSTYIVSPNAFFGKKEDSDTSITGIYLSSDSLTIDGETRTGFYAFDKGEVKVIIDPTKGEYKFVGEIEATSGRFYHSGSNGSLDMYVNADVPYIKASYEEFSLKIQAAKDAFSFSDNNTEYVKIGYFENFLASEAGGIQLNSKDGNTYAELYSSVLRFEDNLYSCYTSIFGGHIDINNQNGSTCIQGAHIKLTGLKDGASNGNYITLSPSDTYTEFSFKGLKSATDATAMTEVSASDVILGEPTVQTWSGKKVKIRQLFWVEQVIS